MAQIQGLGLISSYETKPLCGAGELDLDLLGDRATTFVGHSSITASGDTERGPRLLDLDLEVALPLFSTGGPRRDFNLSLNAGRFSLGLGLRIRFRLRSPLCPS